MVRRILLPPWLAGGATAPPLAPTNLIATPASGPNIALAWSASAGATGYNVYRGTSSGSETLLASGNVPTSYTDSTTTAGTKYYYKVSAVNAAGEGAQSSEVSATADNRIQQTSATSGQSAVSSIMVSPSATQAGSLLIMAVGWHSSGGLATTITMPAGWTKGVSVPLNTDGGVDIWYYASNPGSINSIAINANNSGPNLAGLSAIFAEYAGFNGASVTTTGTNTGTGTTASVSTSGSVSDTNSLVLAAGSIISAVGMGNTPSSWATATGFTKVIADTGDTSSNNSAYLTLQEETRQFTAGVQSWSAQGNAVNSGNWESAILVFPHL